MANNYVGSTKYAAVAAWAASTAYTVGLLRRQLATPAVGSERVFACTTAGTSGASEPTWSLTAGSTTTDGGVTWTEVTGKASYNEAAGTQWGAPHARLANALASGWAAAGDNVFVSQNNAETQAVAMTLTSQGTAAAPVNILCTADSVAPPTALTTGATVTTTGASSITLGGFNYGYGIRFNIGTTSGNLLPAGTSGRTRLDNCTINLANTSNSSVIQLGGASASKASRMELRNPTFLFANAAQRITPAYGEVEIVGGSFAPSGTIPTAVFAWGTNQGSGTMTVRDGDLSTITGAIASVASDVFGRIILQNSKLAAGVSPTTGSFTSLGGAAFQMHACDSAAANYRLYEANYAGVFQSETTVVRTGGASDGTTSLSWNMTTGANSLPTAPLSSPELVEWVATAGSAVNVTVEIASNATLTNADLWMTVEYLGSSGSPQGSVATTARSDILQASTAIATSSATWGGSTTTKQKLTLSFTPQMAGPIKVRFHLAKPSSTVYIDPLATLS